VNILLSFSKTRTMGSYTKFPNLPGCIASTESFEGAPRHAAEVLFDHLADMERKGDPIPEPSIFANITAEADNGGGSIVLIQEANSGRRHKDGRWSMRRL
jgi:predicted RNase H-like HicB family nuclease